jgi:hypothetical protein
METSQKFKVGILAFGSLIDNPGQEIKDIEIGRIDCTTPFNVEFARISSTRNNAPTLIPILDNSKGKKVNAKIILIEDEIDLESAKSILWRRECHKTDKTKIYTKPDNPTPTDVMIGELDNFCNVEKVIYTYFLLQDVYEELNPIRLADFAIDSILSEAGVKEKDGIRYLLSIKLNDIKTEFSEEYEKQILIKTETHSLSEAIEKLDRKRMMYPD